MNAMAEGQDGVKNGIDGVVLSPELITALFAEVMVSLPSPAPVQEGREKPSAYPTGAPIVSLGENRRNICLLVSEPGKEVLPAKRKVFLEKMLGACQLGIADLAIINTRLSPVMVQELVARFAPRQWLIAGLSPTSLDMNIPDTPFEIMDWQGSGVLLLPALSEVDQETPAARLLKRQLWAGLQKLFGL